MNKLIKFAIAAFCFVISSASLAAHENYKNESLTPCPETRLLLNGFYAGLNGGYDGYKVKSNYDVPPLVAHVPNEMSGSVSEMVDGGAAGLFVGYGMDFENFYRTYLGLEVFGNWMDQSKTYNESANLTLFPTFPAGGILVNEGLTIKTKVRGNIGISLLPGIRLNDATLLYVRLGYNWARISVNQTAFTNASLEDLIGNVTPIGNAALISDQSKYTGGFNYGMGIETRIYQNWSARVDYSYTSYNNFDGLSFARIQPSDSRFMLGLVYRNIMGF